MTADAHHRRLPMRLRRAMRLSGSRQFEKVLRSSVFRHAGPLIVYTVPNEMSRNRLGLTVSRRVGTAVRRNTIKRRLREAFRLQQHDLPGGYDVVVRVRTHQPLAMEAYKELLAETLGRLDERWKKSPPPGT